MANPVTSSISDRTIETDQDLADRINRIALQDSSKRIRKTVNNKSLLLSKEEGMGLTHLNTEPNLKVLIVANVHKAVFTNAKIKAHFEELFKLYSKETRFDYLPSLGRVRVEYDSEKNAEIAKNAYNKQNVLGNVVQVFYAKVAVTIDRGGGNFLQVPERERNFLISPPASPPVDWEPIPESHPNIDYDLLAAVANLAPGTEHELIPATGNHPGIIVHISENPDGFTNADRPKIIQTRRPQFNE